MDDGNELEAFRMQPGSVAGVRAGAESYQSGMRGRKRILRQLGAFIRGPIPLSWLDGVLSLPGRVPLVVALALVFQSGLESSATVRFTRKLMDRFRVAPRSASRALEQLQAAGLVRIYRPAGRCREIEILNLDCASSNVTCDK